jgi:hypothetical protein
MITLLTTAKPFKGAARIRQMNALGSWRRAFPDAQILLFGKGDGYEEAARQVGAERYPDISCNEMGMPRIDAMFACGQKQSGGGPIAYVNCDVILFDDVISAVREIPFTAFLMISQRWNFDVHETLDFSSVAWREDLRRDVAVRGQLFRYDAIDFFLWQGDVWRDLPPMVVGRGGYDNWLIYSCRARGIPVVDATERVMIVHQNHDYGHVEGGRDTVMEGPEARRNVELGGGLIHTFKISDSDWRLMKTGLVYNRCHGDARRSAEVFAILHPESSLARSSAGQFVLEAGYEWLARMGGLRKGRLLACAKFLPWLISRALGRR